MSGGGITCNPLRRAPVRSARSMASCTLRRPASLPSTCTSKSRIMSKFPMGYFFILSRRWKPQLRGTFGSSQDIYRDPPEPDEEDRNKAEEQLAEEAGPVIAASLPSKRCGKRESRVQRGGPATVGKTTFVDRFRDHW